MKISGQSARRLRTLFAVFGPLRGREGEYLARGSKIACDVAIGRGTRINGAAFFRGKGAITIGNYCAVGHGLRVMTSNHALTHASTQAALNQKLGVHSRDQVKETMIGHDVWIGDNVILLPGITIGNGAVIGAGAVVTKPVGEYEIWAGNPARMIRRRFDEPVAHLLSATRWWYWPEEKMHRAKALFDADLVALSAAELEALIAGLEN
jgi:virginiamycin A acetyltransferase